ncbi:phosphoesterase RecJ-like protein [Natranaerovirga pectinivora]|uniref:Phosphoesterase RecJ-like protein n=1 Tax=Natranaerovirga pectinivora TaxID=682400 RepID=A0A4R3MKW0_9FIRM|nr:bifunctional oligoribonuclease/PAP phosphatase NrnA [Natranaerovirga pectinivora]TCT15049.1 phosphoesterase RecJ-like protein [Natranaerovirga pectinivora]
MKKKILDAIKNSNKIILSGHMNPDGDSIGSSLALGQYIKKVYPDKLVNVFIEFMPDTYSFLKGQELIISNIDKDEYDLFIALDCGDKERLGEAVQIFENASLTFNIDHHISNTKFANENYVLNASSTSEMVYDLIEKDCINKEIAEALYTGIIFDTGGLKHSNTTKKTLEIIGNLIEYQFNFSNIIDLLFNEKTYIQNKLLGAALMNASLAFGGKCIYAYLKSEDFNKHNGSFKDTDGIIDALRVTKGVMVAFFLYETVDSTFKISFRANDKIDVCKIAMAFNGGGHTKAAGCSITGDYNKIIDEILELIQQQIL